MEESFLKLCRSLSLEHTAFVPSRFALFTDFPSNYCHVHASVSIVRGSLVVLDEVHRKRVIMRSSLRINWQGSTAKRTCISFYPLRKKRSTIVAISSSTINNVHGIRPNVSGPNDPFGQMAFDQMTLRQTAFGQMARHHLFNSLQNYSSQRDLVVLKTIENHQECLKTFKFSNDRSFWHNL